MATTIKQYELRGELGRGGMATVYRAYDTNLERNVALKLLPERFSHDPQFAARFEREAKTISALEHSAIVPIYDYGEHDDRPFLVMRLMTGGSLGDRLRRKAISLEEAAATMSRVAGALDRAHEQGIIHRDLKPDNILYDGDGSAFLADFGIVKIAEGATQVTQAGATLGTPAYMSPEQAQGNSVDHRTDIYALGVIFFQMLTGSLPYSADTAMALAMKHVLEPVPRLADFRSDVPAGAQRVIDQAMAKKPENRFRSAGEFARAVHALAIGVQPTLDASDRAEEFDETQVMAPTMPPRKKRRRRPWIVAGVVGGGMLTVGAVVVIGLLFVLFGGDEDAPDPDDPDQELPLMAEAEDDDDDGEETSDEPDAAPVVPAATEPPPTAIPASPTPEPEPTATMFPTPTAAQVDVDTVFPLPDDARNFNGGGGEELLMYTTDLTLQQVADFYNEVLEGEEYLKRNMGLPDVLDGEVVNMVFDDADAPRALVVQAVETEAGTVVTIRFEEV